ncbi:MAG: reverse transcriptase domain-containing protein [Elusimicrobiota bacterium]|nr:reverse transcriptase domain-containing protein [Elusimicrobiota bacterium]
MAKTYKNLFEKVYEFGNLYDGYLKARKNKRYREDVLCFSSNLEGNLTKLLKDIKNETYRPGKYHRFNVYEPKKRRIHSLPFRDRIVQHALNNIIEPVFEKIFIYDSYACRKEKGTHRGVLRLSHFLRSVSSSAYCFKADIASYFPSVVHDILRREIADKIVDKRLLSLIDIIIFSHSLPNRAGCGLPVGNLTSQLFANIYLNKLDYFVKHELKVHYYIRYVDDFIILDEDKKKLADLKEKIAEFLEKDLALKLNKKSSIFPAKQGVDFLGYRVWGTHRLLRKSSIKRMKKRIKFAKENPEMIPDLRRSLISWRGHCRYADTFNLMRKIRKQISALPGLRMEDGGLR